MGDNALLRHSVQQRSSFARICSLKVGILGDDIAGAACFERAGGLPSEAVVCIRNLIVPVERNAVYAVRHLAVRCVSVNVSGGNRHGGKYVFFRDQPVCAILIGENRTADQIAVVLCAVLAHFLFYQPSGKVVGIARAGVLDFVPH